ncbi:hypothetical protein HHK36_028002 [Tetracentron sinense]|uniref:Uncharacterized protein n=1 Tax=Tetracentron sinense TaxID=13715 RepID=A0A835D222_TETSI|nr:hypothetical protein HHK36_028002 [Tetracentron sinense]
MAPENEEIFEPRGIDFPGRIRFNRRYRPVAVESGSSNSPRCQVEGCIVSRQRHKGLCQLQTQHLECRLLHRRQAHCFSQGVVSDSEPQSEYSRTIDIINRIEEDIVLKINMGSLHICDNGVNQKAADDWGLVVHWKASNIRWVSWEPPNRGFIRKYR